VSPEQAPDYSAAFILVDTCLSAETAELWDSVRRQASFDGDIGPAHLRLRADSARRDWTIPPEHGLIPRWITRARERRCGWRASEPSTIFATGYSAAMFGVNSSGNPL
jgi:hypothetical protein